MVDTSPNIVYVGGYNAQGQLGIGNTTNQGAALTNNLTDIYINSAKIVLTPTIITDLSQIGYDSYQEKITPSAIPSFSGVSKETNKVVRLQNIYVTGYNQYGQFGINTKENHMEPFSISRSSFNYELIKRTLISFRPDIHLVKDIENTALEANEKVVNNRLYKNDEKLTPSTISNFNEVSKETNRIVKLQYVYTTGRNGHYQLGINNNQNQLEPIAIETQYTSKYIPVNITVLRPDIHIINGVNSVTLEPHRKMVNNKLWSAGYNGYTNLATLFNDGGAITELLNTISQDINDLKYWTHTYRHTPTKTTTISDIKFGTHDEKITPSAIPSFSGVSKETNKVVRLRNIYTTGYNQQGQFGINTKENHMEPFSISRSSFNYELIKRILITFRPDIHIINGVNSVALEPNEKVVNNRLYKNDEKLTPSTIPNFSGVNKETNRIVKLQYVYTTGRNGHYQLGINNNQNQLEPIAVETGYTSKYIPVNITVLRPDIHIVEDIEDVTLEPHRKMVNNKLWSAGYNGYTNLATLFNDGGATTELLNTISQDINDLKYWTHTYRHTPTEATSISDISLETYKKITLPLIYVAGWNGHTQLPVGNTENNLEPTSVVNYSFSNIKGDSLRLGVIPNIIEGRHVSKNKEIFYYRITFERSDASSDSSNVTYTITYGEENYDLTWITKTIVFPTSTYFEEHSTLYEDYMRELNKLKNQIDRRIGVNTLPKALNCHIIFDENGNLIEESHISYTNDTYDPSIT